MYFLDCMSSCHSLVLNLEDKVEGDCLEEEMFNFTGARVVDLSRILNSDDVVIHILKKFDFSSTE